MATHVDIVAQFDDRSVMVSANDLKRNLERTGDEAGDAFAKGFEKSAPRIQKAYEKAYSGAANAASTLRAEEAKLSDIRAKAGKEAEQLAAQEAKVEHYRTNLPQLTAALASEEQKLSDLRERHSSTLAQLTVRTEAFTRSVTDQRSAMTNLGRAFSDVENAASGASSGMSGLGGSMGGALAGGALVAGQAIGDLISVAASASQALIALPAAVGAAGAAFGTLQLATMGFDDALKAMGDPKKFGEALKQLSPGAQQAALAIQSVMPELTHLQQATQDAFSVNAAPMINQLTNVLLPTVQQTTTGIAAAMNSAMQGVAGQLLTPETQSSIQTFAQNTVAAFQALAPAAAPLTKALGDLMAVGSSALPQVAAAASAAATEFSNFIDKATKSGDMQRALDAGLNTLEQLAPVALHFGEAFMSLAPVGERVLPSVVKALDETANVLPDIIKLASEGPSIFGAWSDILTSIDPIVKAIDVSMKAINGDIPGINASLNDMISPLHLIAELVDSVKWFFDPGGRDDALHRAQAAADKGVQDRKAFGPGYGGPGGGGGGPFGSPNGPAGIPGVPGGGYGLPFGTTGTGGIGPGVGGDSVIGGWSGGLFSKGSGSGLGTGKKGSAPKLPDAPVLPYDTSMPQGFGGLPQTAELVTAENSYMDARHTLAEKQARVQQLEKTVGATADEIQKAKNDVINAEQGQQQAELRLYAQRDEMFKKTTNQMSEFGANLDKDLGISKGLSGIADNLVRFLGSLALAPEMAKLNATANAPGQAQGGFGAIGIAGAQGAFGPQYTAAGQAAAAGSGASTYSAAAMGPTALQPRATSGYTPTSAASYSSGGVPLPGAGGGQPYGLPRGSNSGGYGGSGTKFPDWVYALGQDFGVKPSTYPGHQETNRNEAGFAPNPQDLNRAIDWSGPVQNMQKFASYLATIPSSLEQVIWKNPNTGQQIGIAGGRDVSQTGYYANDYGGHENHVHTRQSESIPLPGAAPDSMGPAPADPYAPAAGGYGAAPAPGIGWGGPTDLPSVPAGAGGNGFGLGSPGPGMVGQGAGAMPGGPMVGAGAGTPIGAAVAPAGGTGKGGIGASDSTMALAGMAASALDVMAPGAGQAAQTAMKLANRAIQYGGQVAGIGVQGLMQTVLPTGGSELANNSWATKLIGGLAGAAPALPNMAGKKAAPPPPGTPASGQGSGPAPGPGDTHITVNNNRPTEDGSGRDIAHAMQSQYQPPAKP